MISRLIPIIRRGRIFLHQIVALFFILLSSLFALPAWAVDIYFAESNAISDQAKSISSSLKSSTEGIVNHPIETISSKAASSMGGNSNLIVAIGPEALRDIISGQGTAPVVAVFVSKASYESILFDQKPPVKRDVSAVYSDPDPFKQVALTRILYGESSASVVIDSPSIRTYIKDYTDAAAQLGVKLIVINLDEIRSTSDFIRSTKQARSILLLKDHELFRRMPLEKILLSSYDINRQGVIGYSRGLVKNGAAATTFSSLADISTSIANHVGNIEKKLPLNKPGFTATFQVILNKYILRSLDVVDTDEDVLQKKISSLLPEGEKQ